MDQGEGRHVQRIATTALGATRSRSRTRTRRRTSGSDLLNWRLILAVIANIFLWWAIIAGARHLFG